MVGRPLVASGIAGLAILAMTCSTSPVRVVPLPPTSSEAPAAAQPATGETGPSAAVDEVTPSAAPVTSAAATKSAAASTTAAMPTTTQPDLTWTLLAGGDVLMDRSEPSGIDPFQSIEPALDSADLAVVNSEMAISDRGAPLEKQYVFRAPPSAARRIASAGIDVVSLANNHAMDYGPEALVHTVDLLEKAGVVALGAGADRAAAHRHRVVAVKDGVRVAFVGVSMIVPLNFPAGPGSAGIASARPPSWVLDSVRTADGAADVVIVVVHWGVERSTCPSDAQRAFARDLMDAGADAVIGHHPHVLQPVEFSGGRLVAYSLGNFVWHPRWGITGETGVLQIDFDDDEIVGWTFHPHLLNDDGAPVPVGEGSRYDRIVDIVAGDCRRHQPPPPSTTSTAVPSATSTTEAAPGPTSTTVAETTDTTTGRT